MNAVFEHPEDVMGSTEVDRILGEVAAGRTGASDRLIEAVYDDLRRIARSQLGRAGEANGTLGATALIHEAWMRLSGDLTGVMRNRPYFYASAARAMRQALVDHARARGARKRGGDRTRLPLEGIDLVRQERDDELLEVDAVIDRLARQDERVGEVVRLRFWAGLNNSQVAEVLDCSERTVKRDWVYARACIIDALGHGERGTKDSAG